LGEGNLSILRALRRRALEQSPKVYLVGGPVRDALLGAPVRDLDFVVEGDGPELAHQLAEDLGGRVLTHPRFGTATVALNGCHVDVVSARKEVYPQPAALPQVFPGAIEDDLARRDFAVNALALPLGEARPKVLDHHGGVGDLRRGLIRILHPNSFVDDPTRILRAVRYEQRLGFRIERRTLVRLREAVSGGHLAALTGDRLRHELEHILMEDRPGPALTRGWDLGIMAAIHPALGKGKLLARLSAVAELGPAEDGGLREDRTGGAIPLVYLAALTYPLSSGDAESVIHRLNMPRPWAQVVRDTVYLKRREAELAGPSLPRSRLVALVEVSCPEAVMAVSRVAGSPGVACRLAEYMNELRFVTPALNGRDLLAMGVPDGPMVGRVLRGLREAKLDRKVSTEAEERRLVQDILGRGES
jgi:tRNA nucleotidyltransferase (CCA-adding enzyme)